MGVYSVGLVGEAHYQAAIARLRVDECVVVEHEPHNPYDDQAVRCCTLAGETVGYVARDSWLRRCVHDGTAVSARVLEVRGGEPGRPHRGVVLEVRTGPHAE